MSQALWKSGRGHYFEVIKRAKVVVSSGGRRFGAEIMAVCFIIIIKAFAFQRLI